MITIGRPKFGIHNSRTTLKLERIQRRTPQMSKGLENMSDSKTPEELYPLAQQCQTHPGPQAGSRPWGLFPSQICRASGSCGGSMGCGVGPGLVACGSRFGQHAGLCLDGGTGPGPVVGVRWQWGERELYICTVLDWPPCH